MAKSESATTKQAGPAWSLAQSSEWLASMDCVAMSDSSSACCTGTKVTNAA
jgi:hypothetical protein